jgi:hypothetical protein
VYILYKPSGIFPQRIRFRAGGISPIHTRVEYQAADCSTRQTRGLKFMKQKVSSET